MVAAGWSDEQRRAYVLADNQLAAERGLGQRPAPVRARALGAAGFDLDLIGFGNIDALLASGAAPIRTMRLRRRGTGVARWATCG